MFNFSKFLIISLIFGLVHCNTEAGYFHTDSIDVILLNNNISKISKIINTDEILSLDIPNINLDKFREFYIPVNESGLNGFYNIRISWDALSPIEIYKFDIVKDNKNMIYVYLKYRYECFPLVVFNDDLQVKILLSSTVLGFIPSDMVPIVKLICMTAIVGFIGGHYMYKLLVSI